MKANRRKGYKTRTEDRKVDGKRMPQDVPRVPGDTSLSALFDRSKP